MLVVVLGEIAEINEMTSPHLHKIKAHQRVPTLMLTHPYSIYYHTHLYIRSLSASDSFLLNYKFSLKIFILIWSVNFKKCLMDP